MTASVLLERNFWQNFILKSLLLVLLNHCLHLPDQSLHFLGSPVELSDLVLEETVRLLHELKGAGDIASLEHDQSKGELALGSDGVLRPELYLTEQENLFEVLVSFFVVNVLDSGVVEVLHFVEVLLDYEHFPNVNDLLVEVTGFLHTSLFFEQLTHVVIA